MNSSQIRPAALAGSWYASDPTELRRDVARLLDGAGEAPTGRAVVAVVPHAGHVWSGGVAGKVLGLLRDFRYERVVILAPNHRHPLRTISAPHVDAYATPLGTVTVDRDAVLTLEAAGVMESVPAAHRLEHAVEIQLPLLQELWKAPPPIVPLLVPHLDAAARAAAAQALAPWCNGETLFLVSTDFTHFGADFGYLPFRDNLPHRLEELDMGAVSRILAWDADGLRDYGRSTGITMCGLEAMALVMDLAWPRRPETTLIDYARSGDRDRDYHVSVSYAGLLGIWPQENPA